MGLARGMDRAGDFEREVLAGLQRAVGFDVAFFACLGARATTVGLDAERITDVVRSRVYEAELEPIKRAACEARGVAVDTEVLGERAAGSTRYARDLAAPVGGRHSLIAFLGLAGRPLGVLMLGRCGGGFRTREVESLERELAELAAARASYLLPAHASALPPAPSPSVRERVTSWHRGARTLARIADDEQTLEVRDRGLHREMVVRRGEDALVWTRVRHDHPSTSGWFYVDLLHLAASSAASRGRALFIGAGGGVAIRRFAETHPGMEIDLVELDGRVLDLARDWFGLAEVPGLRAQVADGAAFLARAPAAHWDVLVVDAFDTSLPRAFTEPRFFADARRVLSPGGALAFNVIGPLVGRGAVRTTERLARAAFEEVRLVPVLDPGEAYEASAARNVVLIARAGLNRS